jgi:hypothetical protein
MYMRLNYRFDAFYGCALKKQDLQPFIVAYSGF